MKKKDYSTEKGRTDAWYTRKDLQKEQKKWYRILKKEGFRDVETIDWATGDSFHILNTKTYKSTAEVVRDYDPSKERYFELARQRYWDMVRYLEHCPKWLRTKEAIDNAEIWRMWADGLRMSQIYRSKENRKVKGKRTWTQSRIRDVVRNTEAEMLSEVRHCEPAE